MTSVVPDPPRDSYFLKLIPVYPARETPWGRGNCGRGGAVLAAELHLGLGWRRMAILSLN